MSRPRLLLVPSALSVEWAIRPLLEEWAEVAVFDAPGVEGEPLDDGEAFGPDAVARRGVDELDRRGWEKATVIADEFACTAAVRIAERHPERLSALALGHATLSQRSDGDRPALSPAMLAAATQLAHADFRTYARHLTQLTGGAFDESIVDQFLRRVPRELLADEIAKARSSPMSFEDALRGLDCPLLLAKHDGCLMWTDEGWEDVVAAFPGAETMSTKEKPTASPEFAAALRAFTERGAPATSAAS